MLMNGFGSDMVKAFLKSGKLQAITEYAKIKHPSRKRNVILSTYKGSEVRVFSKEDHIHLMYPEDVSEIQMESVADAIAKGTIFDDAETLDNHTDYITMTNVPMNAMTRNGVDQPKHLKVIISGIIGRMSDDGTLEISLTDMKNGQNFMNQIHELDHCDHEDVRKLVDHYIGTKDHDTLPTDLKEDISDSCEEIKDIKKCDDEDCIDEDDYEYMDMGDGDTKHEEYEHSDHDDDDDDDKHVQEGFFSKKPKRLKPIPRDIIAYITVEINAIQDDNDKAMLAGYACSKIELVDFYLNCIDTQDDRYIVPHTKQYLVQMQTDLNRLLNQILKIRSVDRAQGVWKQDVTLPEGWR